MRDFYLHFEEIVKFKSLKFNRLPTKILISEKLASFPSCKSFNVERIE